jgi:hypothetical protein
LGVDDIAPELERARQFVQDATDILRADGWTLDETGG